MSGQIERELLTMIETGTQKDVAEVYAESMADGSIDWLAVNGAIIERWSLSGLRRVKDMAWGIVEREVADRA